MPTVVGERCLQHCFLIHGRLGNENVKVRHVSSPENYMQIVNTFALHVFSVCT